MIWYYIMSFFGNMLNLMFSWLPRVDILPLGIDGYLSSAITSFKAFSEIFPPLALIFQAFMFYMAFKVSLLTLKLLRIIK